MMTNRVTPTDSSPGPPSTPPTIARGRRRLRLILVTAMCLVAFTGLTVLTIFDALRAKENAFKTKTLQTSVKLSIEIADLVHTLQIERGTRVLYVSSGRDHVVLERVLQAGNSTDELAKNLDSWPENEQDRYNFSSLETFLVMVNNHRNFYSVVNSTIQDEIMFYSKIISNLFEWLFRNVQEINYDVLSEFIAYRMILIGKEKTGVERALGGSFFSRGRFLEIDDLLWFAENNVLGKENLKAGMELMPEIKDFYKRAVEEHNGSVLVELEQKRKIILSNKEQNASVESGGEWFQLITGYINALLQVQQETGALILERLDNESPRPKMTGF